MAFGFLNKLKEGLKKTRELLTTPIGELLAGRKVDEKLLAELEEHLIRADVGPRLAMEMVEDLRNRIKKKEVVEAEDVRKALEAHLASVLTAAPGEGELRRAVLGPTVVLLVGVNGTGKTTTAAKLARFLKDQGYSVLLGAADTFRAAAGEQLDVWASRVGVQIIRHRDGADPAAVVFDACEAAIRHQADYLIIDTAGRAHTKTNLMHQLEKIHRVAGKKIEGAPHEVLLVLDATTGQNALSQAKTFGSGVGITGLVLTKLDGTAKGGVVVAIKREVGVPIKFVGTGERETDLAPFDAASFVAAMFEEP